MSPPAPSEICITRESRKGSVALSTGSSEEVRLLQDEFRRQHFVVLRSFVSGSLLDQLRDDVEAGDFEVRVDEGIATELWQRGGRGPTRLWFIANDPELFELVDEITSCGTIRSFVGRVFRMLPGREHEDSWHDDDMHGRLIAMSINLSSGPYAGGTLEIRDSQSKKVLSRVSKTNPGDAVLFRIAPGLQHKVSSLRGDVPRTTYAGWFTSKRPPFPNSSGGGQVPSD
jgi:hypothetical protein